MRHLPTRCTRSPTFGLATERGSMCVHCARFGGATRQHVCTLRTLWWCYAAACVYTAHALVVLRGSMCVHSARFGGATRQHVCILRTLWCYAAACVYTAHALVLRGSMCVHCAPWCYAAACVYTAHALVLRGSMRVHCARFGATPRQSVPRWSWAFFIVVIAKYSFSYHRTLCVLLLCYYVIVISDGLVPLQQVALPWRQFLATWNQRAYMNKFTKNFINWS